MAILIKISKEVAQSIGKIDYIDPSTGCKSQIDPFCSEQKDGTYLMDEKTYLKAMQIPEVKQVFEKIDFEGFEKIEAKDSDLKTEK